MNELIAAREDLRPVAACMAIGTGWPGGPPHH
jgi:hypothetical protein